MEHDGNSAIPLHVLHNSESNGQFNFPAGITSDSTGNLIVVDGKNNRLQVFDRFGNHKRILTSSNKEAFHVASDLQLFSDGTLAVSGYAAGKVFVFSIE